jgi:multisubunit Na+/H+ antiporter MnhG subunit
MGGVGLLILFAILGAFICAKTRAAAGAVVFSLIALVLFIGTPVGQSLPGAASKVMSTVDQATTPALNNSDSGVRR